MLEKQIKDLFELVEVRYLKKQKQKTDFLMEIKNLESKLAVFGEKINENVGLHDIIILVFNYIKLLDVEVQKANIQYKHSNLWLLESANQHHHQADPKRKPAKHGDP
jgi:hypothetical protein